MVERGIFPCTSGFIIKLERWRFKINMEASYTTLIASRGWHVYGKTVWQSPRRGEKLEAEKESNQNALIADPYSFAWTRNCPSKLWPDVVGHIPREISRFSYFFLNRGGSIDAEVHSARYLPSPIPKGGLEILLSVTFKIADENRRYLTRLIELINNNYDVPQQGDIDFENHANELDNLETVNEDMEDPVEHIMLIDDEDMDDDRDNDHVDVDDGDYDARYDDRENGNEGGENDDDIIILD